MKYKLMIAMFLFTGIIVISNAECTKDEIRELVDLNFSKSDITWVCDRRNKWLAPLADICEEYNGRMDKNGYCEANWTDAKNICHVIGGRLPNLDELKKVVSECGGINVRQGDKNYYTAIENNMKNKNYRQCYKSKGFASYYYWSSDINFDDSSIALGMGFGAGDESEGNKSARVFVSCVKSGK